MKAVTYCRVSSKEQEESGYSLPAQEKFLREYAERHSFEVSKVFSVAESASGVKQRQIFAEMMAYMQKHAIKILICEKVDRLSRNFKDAVEIDEWIQSDEERQVHLVKDSLVMHKNSRSQEKLNWGVRIIFAKNYIDNLSEEVKKGQAEKIRQGWLPTKPPLGYKTTGEKGRKVHVIDSEKGSLVREMFELYSTGQYSIRKLCLVMKEKGLRTGLGNALVKSRMAEILGDPFYYGAMRWNGETYEAKHEPLISRGLFDEVQRILHKGSAPLYSKHLHTLKGFVKCAECGGLVTWEEKKGIVYGHCNSYRKCTKRPWYKEAEVVSQLAGVFEKLVIKSKRIREWLRETLRESNRSEGEMRQTKLAALQGQIDRIGLKLDRAYEDRLDGRISAEAYDKKAKELEHERCELQAEVARQHNTGDETRELRVEIYNLSQAAPEIFKNASPEKRRTLVGLVFEKLEMVDGALVATLKEPFAALEKAARETNSSKMPELFASPTRILELVENGSKEEETADFDFARSTLLRG
ncbi:MAG TPA: recombinase family protein [Candidatus Paceibacterota bacterium]